MVAAMEIIDELTARVSQVVRELADVKKDRQLLLSEVETLRSQVRELQSASREIERMKQDKEQIRSRLVRLSKKIDKHLLVETTLASQANGGLL